jgi:hypothetical protein
MSKAYILMVACLALAACNKSPADKQADAIEKTAADHASQIRQQASAQASGLDQQAKTLHDQAQTAGGFTGERLKVQGDALAKEADIVKRQGEAQADAATKGAAAQAETIRSR